MELYDEIILMGREFNLLGDEFNDDDFVLEFDFSIIVLLNDVVFILYWGWFIDGFICWRFRRDEVFLRNGMRFLDVDML